MKEKCPRCGYTWNFKGKLRYRRTCPNCGYNWILPHSYSRKRKR